MPTNSTAAPAEISDAFLAILHHVIFEMTPEQAAALMADDEPITAGAHPRTAFHGHDTSSLIKACEHAWEIL
jgi:hypothetical protein